MHVLESPLLPPKKHREGRGLFPHEESEHRKGMPSANFPSVVVVTGAQAGASLNLDEVLNNFILGSDESCNLVLTGAAISPIHATLFLDDTGFVTVADANSRDGVFVNGAQVKEQQLADGDQISLGSPDDPESTTMRFAAQAADAPDQALFTSELSAANFRTEAAAFAPLPDLEPLPDLPSLEDLSAPPMLASPRPVEPPTLPALPDLPAFEEVAAERTAFEAPAFEPLPEVPAFEPLPEVPAFEPASEPTPEGPGLLEDAPELSTEPEPVPAAFFEAAPEPPPEPEPQPEPEPEPVAPPAPPVAQPPKRAAAPKLPRTPNKSATADRSADPLAGLAESLGGSDGEGFVPPPAAAPQAATPAKKAGPPPAVMVARVAAVAVVLVLASWFGMKKYTESIVIPVVDTYLPNPAEPGQIVTINGSGFGADPDPTIVKVMLGKVEAEVLDANPTRINITVPELMANAGSQTVQLYVGAQGMTSAGRLLKIAVTPKIASLTPRVALSGEEVVIAGKWLGNPKNKPVVTVAGSEAEILEAGSAQLRIKVPEVSANEGQRVSLKVTVGADVSKEALLNFGRLPFIESITPSRALPGEVVTLAGLGLSGADLSIMVAGRTAAILGASDTEAKFSLPGLPISQIAGVRELTVQANQKMSRVHDMEILRESSAFYSPRFFVQLIEGGRAAVSCELGPLMALGPEPESRKRAHDAAAQLNTLAATARDTRVQFAATEAVISVSGAPLLNVGPTDGSGNPRVTASVWAAQLNDIFDLFFQGRRPGRTVELSPDGKVFIDIHAAARRRSNQPGVPPGVLSSPDPAWLHSLGTLALKPSLDASQALTLLDGYWSGVIEASRDQAPRNVEISLTVTPSGLVGRRTSRQGRLSTDMHLQDIFYVRRELRFAFAEGSQRLNFSGRLDGDVIDGTVTNVFGGPAEKLILRLSR